MNFDDIGEKVINRCKELMNELNDKYKKINYIISKAHGKLTNEQVLKLKLAKDKITKDGEFLYKYSKFMRKKYNYYK